VDFREISPDEIEFYIASQEPFDKAGGYGIQGFAGVFVTAIRGSYHNVVGLPLAQTAQLLGEAKLYKLW
jgi:septum formation protein